MSDSIWRNLGSVASESNEVMMWPHGEIEVEQPLQWCIQDIDIVFLEFVPPLFGIREKRVAAIAEDGASGSKAKRLPPTIATWPQN